MSGETQNVIGGTEKVSGGTLGMNGDEHGWRNAWRGENPTAGGRAGCPHPAVGNPDATGIRRRAGDRRALPDAGGWDGAGLSHAAEGGLEDFQAALEEGFEGDVLEASVLASVADLVGWT